MHFYNRFSHDMRFGSGRSSTVVENIRKFESFVHKAYVDERHFCQREQNRDRNNTIRVQERVVNIEGPKDQFGPRVSVKIRKFEELVDTAWDKCKNEKFRIDKTKQIRQYIDKTRKIKNKQQTVREGIRKFENFAYQNTQNQDETEYYPQNTEYNPVESQSGKCVLRERLDSQSSQSFANQKDTVEKVTIHVNQYETKVRANIRKFEELHWQHLMGGNETFRNNGENQRQTIQIKSTPTVEHEPRSKVLNEPSRTVTREPKYKVSIEPSKTVLDDSSQAGFSESSHTIFNGMTETGFDDSDHTAFNGTTKTDFDYSDHTSLNGMAKTGFNDSGRTAFNYSIKTDFNDSGRRVFNDSNQTDLNEPRTPDIINEPMQTLINDTRQVVATEPEYYMNSDSCGQDPFTESKGNIRKGKISKLQRDKESRRGATSKTMQIPKIYVNFEHFEKLEIRELRTDTRRSCSRIEEVHAKTRNTVKECILKYEQLKYQSGVSLNIDSTRF